MRQLRRLILFLIMVGLATPIVMALRYPDTGSALIQKALKEYRSGIQGEMRITEPGKWNSLGKGIALRRIEIKRGNEVLPLILTAVRFDPAEFQFKVSATPMEKVGETSISQVAKKLGAVGVINGSFFNPNIGILGLAISGGKSISKVTVAGENRGIFAVKHHAPILVHRDIFYDMEYNQGTTEAIQSGPWLVVADKPQTTFKHPAQISRRSAVGMDKVGRVLFVVTDTVLNGIAFGNFAKLLAEDGKNGFGCKSALNLDGGTSTQLWVRNDKGGRFVRGMLNVPVYLVAIPKEGK